MYNLKNKKTVIFTAIFLLAIFLISRVSLRAEEDPYKNKIKIKEAKITSIETGSASSGSDGLDYSDNTSNTLDTSFIAGYDSSPNNRIVRSFDTIKYHIEFSLQGKDQNVYENRNVVIQTLLTAEESKYVDEESKNDIIIEDLNTYGDKYEADVYLKVLGAPNGFKIEPKFIIKEQTDEDEPVTLGKNNNVYNYSYSNGTYNNVADFMNYMPTVVSSVPSFNIYVRSSNDNPLGTYNNISGRYMNYVIGMEVVGIGDGIKGVSYPTDDITFNLRTDNNSLIDTSWIRVYDNNTSVGDIAPAVMPSPYGNKVESSNSIYNNPGNVSITGENGNYTVSIKNYAVTIQKFPSKNADNSAIDSNKGVFGSYALTLFSKRESGNTSPITSSVQISNINLTGYNEVTGDNSASKVNEYYESSDYSLDTGFIKSINNQTKLSKDGNGKGSVSKGDNIAYKTTFKYLKSNSDTGIKEIIKIDPVAFRVLSTDITEDVSIKLKCGDEECKNITKDDFEIKFISGDYDNENYILQDDFSKISEDERNVAVNKCNSLNLSDYNSDQIMNLYGGPCIKAKENIETSYEKIKDAKTEDNKEIPITKIIVQTKENVKLPKGIQIDVIVNLRVRDIADITKTYQVTTAVMSSDYDDVIKYYTPAVLDNENSITSPNNYRKSIYNYNSLVSKSSNLWGDSLKIVNYVARNTIGVINKNKDGSIKNTFTTKENETIKYKVATTIEDMNEQVGADDVWWINSLNIEIVLPKELDYIDDKKLGTPTVINNQDGTTTLIYNLPYTKPNMNIDEIRFNAKLKPNIKGSKNEVTVTSTVNAVNINNEVDTSIIGSTSSSYTIYATGEENVISMQKVGSSGSVVEKDKTIEYLLSAYNNTKENITDYSILDILPYNNDKNGSVIDGTYDVKITLPNGQNTAKVYCTTKRYDKLTNEVDADNNDFEECDLTNDYKNITAFKITGLQVVKDSYLENIKVNIKPKDNKYSNSYINKFYGKASGYSQTESNEIEIRVVSRTISGKVFVDTNLDGVQNDGNFYVKDIPVTLYKVNNEGIKEIASTVTNEKGEYKFKDLDSGRYKLRLKYDHSKYDLSLRYAIEDTNMDSDAYKISDNGDAEISSKVVPGEVNGIILSSTTSKATNMDMGLIPRTTFGFEMKKYITKIELNANNTLSTYNYDNVSTASISVKNSAKATAKIYYGISITNNSTTEGYIKLVQEDIPNGLYFDKNDPYNEDWFELDGVLYSQKFKTDLIKPGETRYLQIALNMPRREEAGTFLNTASVAEMQPLDKSIADEAEFDTYDDYKVGDEVSYAGVKWNVIKNENSYLTLLASKNTITGTMSHGNNPYKWSTSNINKFINNDWQNLNSLNLPILQDNLICDDASGLETISYGGTLKEDGTCISNIYNSYKVRLLTEREYADLLNDTSFTDKSFLNGNFALTNATYVSPQYNAYGNITNGVSNYSRRVSGTSVVNASTSTKLNVRPVIIVSSDNVMIE